MSPLVFGAIAPHGGLAIEEWCLPGEEQLAAVTREGMRELGRRCEAAAAEAIVLASPHSVHVEGHFGVVRSGALAGSLGEPGQPVSLARRGDPELGDAVLGALRAEGVPAGGLTFGSRNPSLSEMPMDWGTLVPLWFLPDLPTVVVSPPRDRPLEEHVAAGRAIAAAVGQRRVALIASADHSHTHAEGGPYHVDAEAAREYDGRVVDLVRDDRLDGLLELGELAERALADSLWQMLILHGALGGGWRAELLSYEAPTYFGMLCAAFEPRARDALRSDRRGAPQR